MPPRRARSGRRGDSPPDVQPARLAALSARHGATIFLATAALYPYLVRGAAPTESFRGVRHFLSGAATLHEATAAGFRERFGRDIVQTYGLTEASPVVTANPPHDNRTGTVGPALPGSSSASPTANSRSAERR